LVMNCSSSESMQVHMMVHMKRHKALEVASLVVALAEALVMNCSNSESMQVHTMVHMRHHRALEVEGEQGLLLGWASSIHELVAVSNIVESN